MNEEINSRRSYSTLLQNLLTPLPKLLNILVMSRMDWKYLFPRAEI
jgi:hypothetical protein